MKVGLFNILFQGGVGVYPEYGLDLFTNVNASSFGQAPPLKNLIKMDLLALE